jgi:hypothetical protein
MKKNEYSIVVIENSQLGREVLVNSLNTFENIQVELEVDEVETCIALLAGGARFDAVVFVLDLFSGNWIKIG